MIVEALRMHNTWLEDGTYGVNAQITAMAAASLIASGETPAAVAFIGNSFDDEIVARWEDPPKRPAIYITLDAPVGFEEAVATGQHRQTKELVVGIRYIIDDADLKKGMRSAGYTMRAITKSLQVLNTDAQAANRLLRSIELVNMERVLFGEINEAVGESVAIGGVVAFWQARDQSP